MTIKSKHTHDFMTSITALFNQKHSLNVICVAILLLIWLEVGQQRPLQIKPPYRAGVRTRGRLLLFTLSHTARLLSQIKYSDP